MGNDFIVEIRRIGMYNLFMMPMGICLLVIR